MKTLATFILLFAIWCAPLAFAQEVTPRTQIETLLSSIKPGQIELAIGAFAKDSLMPDVEVDRLESQADTLLPGERTVLSFEFISEQTFGTSVKRLVYILKTNDQPLVWHFWYYKPNGKWLPLRVVIGYETLLY